MKTAYAPYGAYERDDRTRQAASGSTRTLQDHRPARAGVAGLRRRCASQASHHPGLDHLRLGQANDAPLDQGQIVLANLPAARTGTNEDPVLNGDPPDTATAAQACTV